jgi:hypothetical protein
MKMKKVISMLLCTLLIISALSVIVSAADATPSPKVDVVTSASIVNTNDAFVKAVSPKGGWITAVLNDLKFDKEVVIDGQIVHAGLLQRKIALYAQDAKRVVTARYTITVPKLTVKSYTVRIQSGIIAGDIYVEGKNFSLIDTTVKGNIYFLNNAAKTTFKMDKTSKVTGVKQLLTKKK